MKQEPEGRELGIIESQRWHRLIGRLLNTLGKRYHADFRFVPFARESSDWQLLTSLLHRNQMIRLNGSCYFPVMHKHQLAGAVELKGAELSSATLQWIHAVVDLVAPLAFFKETELATLMRLEQEIEMLLMPKGLLRIDRPRERALSLIDQRSGTQFDFSKTNGASYRAPCFIDSRSSIRSREQALELHANSQNTVFVPYRDLDQEVRDSAVLLNQLSSVTVYLQDPQQMSVNERRELMLHLRSAALRSSIFWVVSSSMTYSELLRCPQIEPSLIRSLSVQVIKLDKIKAGSDRPIDLH